MSTDLRSHWDAAYERGEHTVSWYQESPRLSLAMLDEAGVSPDARLVDVGGGASVLVDALLDRGHADVTVLDVSPAGLATARQRLGARGDTVEWVVADVLEWRPDRAYDVWHDRAVFHFLTSPADQARYAGTLRAAVTGGGLAVFGVFAPDGPERCSGLPVARHDAASLGAMLGDGWRLVAETREEHVTPGGGIQPFTWAAFRRDEAAR